MHRCTMVGTCYFRFTFWIHPVEFPLQSLWSEVPFVLV